MCTRHLLTGRKQLSHSPLSQPTRSLASSFIFPFSFSRGEHFFIEPSQLLFVLLLLGRAGSPHHEPQGRALRWARGSLWLGLPQPLSPARDILFPAGTVLVSCPIKHQTTYAAISLFLVFILPPSTWERAERHCPTSHGRCSMASLSHCLGSSFQFGNTKQSTADEADSDNQEETTQQA